MFHERSGLPRDICTHRSLVSHRPGSGFPKPWLPAAGSQAVGMGVLCFSSHFHLLVFASWGWRSPTAFPGSRPCVYSLINPFVSREFPLGTRHGAPRNEPTGCLAAGTSHGVGEQARQHRHCPVMCLDAINGQTQLGLCAGVSSNGQGGNKKGFLSDVKLERPCCLVGKR